MIVATRYVLPEGLGRDVRPATNKSGEKQAM
jgi:hypothetical protein